MKVDWKRILSFVLALCLCVGFIPVTARAAIVDSGTCGDNVTWKLDDKGTLTISGTGPMEDYDFCSYENPWYPYRDSIRNAVIESGVTCIGEHAFCECSSLTNITIPDTVTSIDWAAFWNCSSLASITIPESVTSIGVAAFGFCNSLTSITIPKNVTSIGGDAFRDCYSLTDITIPEGVTCIELFAFNNCSSLTSITIPKTVTSIEDEAFLGCSKLTDVYFGGTEEQWNAISIESENDELINAKIHFNCSKVPIDQFSLPVYRASLLSDSVAAHDTDYYLNRLNRTPSSEMVSAAKETGFSSVAKVWEGITLAFDTADDVSNLPEKLVFEQKDIYSGIIMSSLEVAVEQNTTDQLLKTAKETKEFSGTVLDSLRTVYDWTVFDYDSLSKLPKEERKKLKDILDDYFREEFADLSSLDDFLDNTATILEGADTIATYIEQVYTYASFVRLTDSMKKVISEMYRNTPKTDDYYHMRLALADCIDLLNVSADTMWLEITDKANVNVAGRYALKTCSNVFWKGVKKAAPPEVAIIMASYKASKFLSNQLFNTDAITESYFKMYAVLQYEQIVKNTISSLEKQFMEDRTPEAAEAFLDSINLLYRFAFEDCELASSFISSVDKTTMNKLLTILGGHDFTSQKESINSMLSSYQSEHHMFNTIWIEYLEADYPELFTEYSALLDMGPVDPFRTYTIACPVNVFVYDSNGNLVAAVNENVPFATDLFSVAVIGDEKEITFWDDAEYTIICEGYDSGTMDVSISEFSEGELVRQVNFFDASVSSSAVYEMHTNADPQNKSTYCMTTERGKTVKADFDSKASNNSPVTVTIEGGYFGSQDGLVFNVDAYAGQVLEISAIVPDGYDFVGWTITELGEYIDDISAEKTTVRIPDKNCRIEALFSRKASDIPVTRVFGADRYATSFKAADTLKSELGVSKFQNIIVASGTGFADALAGSYLAAVKNAPILLVKGSNVNAVKDYIKQNMTSGGTVYLLGGVNAVPKTMETGLDGFTVKRLGGADRYETNLLILKEAGVGNKDIIVCTGLNFADSLSASASGLPILLVKGGLTDSQKAFLKGTSGKKIIVGGTSAVSGTVESQLKTYGSVKRLAGDTRYDTSVLVAKEFFSAPKAAVLAYAKNFPDGLSGGPLAYALKAPLILTDNGKPAPAIAYATGLGIKSGYVLGGTGLISDKVAKNIFSMASGDSILVK